MKHLLSVGPLLIAALSSLLPAQGFPSKPRVHNVPSQAGEGFGVVDTYGQGMVVGIPGNDDRGTDAGSASVFRLGAESEFVGALHAADGTAGDRFGLSVALGDDRIVVGAPGDDDFGSDSGSAYVFRWNGASWQQEQKLFAVDGSAGDRFGTSVAIAGDVVAVGAYQFGGVGAVFVYRHDGELWRYETTLVGDASLFGFSIAASGDRIAVGAFGSVWMYRDFGGGEWALEAPLFPFDGATNTVFGVSVDLYGEQLAVGAWLDSTIASNAGAAYVYGFDGAAWQAEAKLTPFDGNANQFFGGKVAIREDRVVVGSHADDDLGTNSGSVYSYGRFGSNWLLETKLLPLGGTAWEGFGGSVALGEGSILVGVSGDDTAALDAGSVQIFCPPTDGGLVEQPPTFNPVPHTETPGTFLPPSGIDTPSVPTPETHQDTTIFDDFSNFSPGMSFGAGGEVPGGCCADSGGSGGNDFMSALNQIGYETVLPHSGQEVRNDLDLFIRGRDDVTHLQIARRHISRRNQQFSPFGPAWSFNLKQWFRQLPDGALEIHAYGRADRFEQVAPLVWQGGTGRLDRIAMDASSGQATLRMPGGTRLVFAVERRQGFLAGVLTQVLSPNGNRIAMHFETPQSQPDLLMRRMVGITDSFGRPLSLQYLDPDYPQGVSSIVDFDGREVRYDYNSAGQLLSVRSPRVVSTGGLNDFANGKTTTYGYLGHPDPRLRNALSSVVYPAQSAAGGEPRLRWTYVTDLASPYFGYVATHTIGNPGAPGDLAAGGSYSYDYQRLAPTGSVDDALMLTVITDRVGTRTEIDSNHLGQVLRESIYAPSTGNVYTRMFRYNADGDLILEIDPLGAMTRYEHADPATHPRASWANQTEVVRTPDSRGASQAEIRTRVVYEPIFNRPFQVTEARGFEAGNDPADYTTTIYLDYMEDLPAAIAFYAPQLGLSAGELAALMTAAGIVDLGGDVNGDGSTDQRCGNVIQMHYPRVDLPNQARLAGITRRQEAFETRRYNAFGQPTYHRDPEGNVLWIDYFAAQDPDGDGSVDVPGADPTTGGYQRRMVADAEGGTGRNSGADPQPAVQVTRYEYRAQGSFPGNRRGLPTAVVDPRGVETWRLINELDEEVQVVRAAAVSPGSGLTAFAYSRITLYDANGQVVEVRTERRDTADGASDFIVERMERNILDHLVQVTRDVGGADETVTRYGYDANENLTQRTRGVGTPDQTADRWRYDERDMVIEVTRGVGSAEVATIACTRDENGNIVSRYDAEGGDVDMAFYDGFDRPLEAFDRVGSRTTWEYDADHHVISERRYGLPAHDANQQTLLAEKTFRYDNLGRLFREDRSIFHYSGRAVGAIDDGRLNPGDGKVSTVYVYDRLGRPVAIVDAERDVHRVFYDGLSRVLRRVDPLGNQELRTWDASNNLIGMLEIENSPLLQGAETFSTEVQFDALNRPVAVIEPNGQTTRTEYDSRGLRTRVIDALGNETEMRHDRLGRMVEERIYLSADGTGASATNSDSTQGGGDGRITRSQRWDALSRLVARVDDRGNAMTMAYDALGRLVSRVYADGSSEILEWNRDGELMRHTDPNGSVKTWVRDGKGRPQSMAVDNGLSVAIGTNLKAWGFDGLDRVTRSYDDNGAGEDVTVLTVWDSLSRKLRETQQIGSRASLDVDGEWQGRGRRVSLTFPNGRKLIQGFDALDRLETVRESDQSLVARFDYVGRSRDLRVRYGNGALLDKRNRDRSMSTAGAEAGYDANRRHLRQIWKAADGRRIVDYESAYDGFGGVGTNRLVAERRAHLSGRTDTWSFDSAYRMVAFDRSGVASTASWDGADKLTGYVHEGRDMRPRVDTVPQDAGLNQYSFFGEMHRSYDDKGNLTDDGRLLFYHDCDGRVVEVRRAQSGDLLARYGYDANGRRVLKRTETSRGAVEARFLFDGWSVIEERDGGDVARMQFVEGRRLDEHLQMKSLWGVEKTFYYHCNGQGFVGALTDANGTVVEHYEYDLFGEAFVRPYREPQQEESLGGDEGQDLRVLSKSTVGNPYLFQGRRLDAETGLYLYRHRYYSPTTGEFTTVDPSGLWTHGQGNGYSAFSADSRNRVDPMGLFDWSTFIGTYMNTLVDLLVVREHRAIQKLASATLNLNVVRGHLSCGQAVNNVNRADLTRAFNRSMDAKVDLGKAKLRSTGLAVFGGVLSGVSEGMDSKGSGASTSGSVSNGLGVGAAQTALNLNPVGATVNLVSSATDSVAELAGFQKPGVVEVFNNGGRAVAGITHYVATGDCSAMESTVRRMRSGKLGSVTQAIAGVGDWLGEKVLYKLFE